MIPPLREIPVKVKATSITGKAIKKARTHKPINITDKCRAMLNKGLL